MNLEDAMAELPLVAIIRGVTPDNVIEVSETLYEEGVRIIEVPLNSPSPLHSIRRLGEAMGDRIVFGGGTLLTAKDSEDVKAAGGQIAVSPNTDVSVITRSVELGMSPMPGFASCSEAFQAIKAGALYLKLFPAATYGPGHLKQLKDVLPRDVVVAPVGGVGAAEVAEWWAAGARAFGVGGGIYKAGDTLETVRDKARALVAAVRAVHQT
jgi:2-dehydro-3-deoxyphosphogalactonate aldolase